VLLVDVFSAYSRYLPPGPRTYLEFAADLFLDLRNKYKEAESTLRGEDEDESLKMEVFPNLHEEFLNELNKILSDEEQEDYKLVFIADVKPTAASNSENPPKKKARMTSPTTSG